MFVSCTYVFVFKPIHCLNILLPVLPLLLQILCRVGFVNGNPSGSWSKVRFKKASVEEWVFISGEPSDGQNTKDVPVLHSTDHADCFPETPRTSRQFDSQPTKPQDKACFWERIEAPLPPLRPRPKCNFIHPRQLGPFPGRLELPFFNEILSGYEEFDSRNRSIYYAGEDERARNPGPACG